MPSNAVYVGRPSRWGNPYRIGRDGDAQACVDLYRSLINNNISKDIKEILRGKDLVCWCKLNEPCHADVLLEIANKEAE